MTIENENEEEDDEVLYYDHVNGDCSANCPHCNNHLADEAIGDLADVIRNTNDA